MDDASSNYLMTRELQSTIEASRIEWSGLRNHIPCMEHLMQLALGTYMSSLGVKDCTKSWEAHECDQQFGENESTDIGKSQRLRREGNPRINKVSAMGLGLAKIIEKVRISIYFETAKTDLHIAENTCCIDYADTLVSKRVHWLSNSHSTNCSPTNYGSDNSLEFDTGVAWASLPLARIHPRVAYESLIQRLPATLHNRQWMDHHQVCHRRFTGIQVPGPLDVATSYCDSASLLHSLRWHVQSYGWRDMSIGQHENTIEGRLILCCEVCTADAVQILYWRYSYNWYASYFSRYPSSCPQVVIFLDVGQPKGY